MKKLIKLFTTALLCLTLLAATLGLSACSDKEKVITIGASPTPHAEILKDVVAGLLEKEGYTLKVTEYNDYVLPNTAVENGDLDANYFQHNLYMEDFNATRNTHLKAVANVHYEPFAIYRGTYKSGDLSGLPNGSKVLIPNDGTNEARALYLLQQSGLITLKADVVSSKVTKLDITSNPKNLDIVELEAAQVPISLQDGAIGVINGNYALGNGLKLEDAIATEDATSENTTQYVNVIAVKVGNENSAKIQALVKAITGDEVKAYIQEKYNGAVVTVF
ncbi:MAG: MetQ/NlpA family ABC transporter substrate-binding protein [Clostridiales bacterium]|nr:MetQ/NlpA family ABC transporter substrate-binding protein [Clostridiales bacterium]